MTTTNKCCRDCWSGNSSLGPVSNVCNWGGDCPCHTPTTESKDSYITAPGKCDSSCYIAEPHHHSSDSKNSSDVRVKYTLQADPLGKVWLNGIEYAPVVPTNSSEKCPGECQGGEVFTKCPFHITTPEKQGWEREYEEKFGSLRFRGNPKSAIKSFIRSQIKQAEARGRAEIIKKYDEIVGEFGDQGLEVVGPILDEWFHNPGREVEY